MRFFGLASAKSASRHIPDIFLSLFKLKTLPQPHISTLTMALTTPNTRTLWHKLPSDLKFMVFQHWDDDFKARILEMHKFVGIPWLPAWHLEMKRLSTFDCEEEDYIHGQPLVIGSMMVLPDAQRRKIYLGPIDDTKIEDFRQRLNDRDFIEVVWNRVVTENWLFPTKEISSIFQSSTGKLCTRNITTQQGTKKWKCICFKEPKQWYQYKIIQSHMSVSLYKVVFTYIIVILGGRQTPLWNRANILVESCSAKYLKSRVRGHNIVTNPFKSTFWAFLLICRFGHTF